MIGYKAMNPDMTCRGFQYEVGKTYVTDGPPVLCGNGFHFCERVADVWEYYNKNYSDVYEVEALGTVVTDGMKSCTDRMRVIRRMPHQGQLKWAACGHGNGNGYSSGNGSGNGHGFGYGNSSGGGYGDGIYVGCFGHGFGGGHGFGYVCGSGNGHGFGYGYGYGDGSGYGYGHDGIEIVMALED